MHIRLTRRRLLWLSVPALALSGCGAAAPTMTPTRPPATAAPKPAATTQPAQGGTTPMAKQYSAPPPMSIDQNKTYTATLKTSAGDIVIEFLPKEAPNTVNNFVFLARDGFYNNVVFHRIVKGFMVQTGDPTGTGRGGPGYRFNDEPVTRDYKRGIVAMANAGKNTNGSQFFIMHGEMGLPKDYVIFGQVTDKASLDTLDKIANTPVKASPQGEMSVPTQEVKILSVTITEK